ncbi:MULTISPECIES: hypothetical protein [unclassified Caballeronia]|uniref:DUF7941 domain-family protein n=1 Tax=unclassified Caballeronia TaxID=2646786 RepID=UPI002028CE13|nr:MULTISPECIES: hypothetical protein [unclassified Caballeronia]
MQIDSSKSPIDNVLALINAANSISLRSDDVTLTPPTPIDPNGNHGNTAVTVLGGVSGRYTGAVEVHYTRLSPNRAAHHEGSPGIPTIPINIQSTNASVLHEIATLGNLIESELSLVETEFDASMAGLTLLARDGSLVYVGSDNVNCQWVNLDIAAAAAVVDLPGFDAAT